MGKSKLLIFVLTAVLVCTAVFAGIRQSQGDRPIYAEVTSQGNTEKLPVWYNTHYGIAYIFLPGYAQMDQVRLRTYIDGGYTLGEYSVYDGMTCEVFSPGESYRVSAPEGYPYDGKDLIFFRSGGVSTLFLDLQSGSLDYLHEDKTHDEPAAVRLYGEDGSLLYTGSADAVSGRGQSSWLEEEKKPYNIKLREAADLLGLGSAQKWVLLANAKDASHLRNKLVFDLAAEAGLDYTPECQWVDLYMNGEYLGLYLLCEKIEVHPQRVDISGEGSFLMSKDYPWRFDEQGDPYITTADGASLAITSSDMSPQALLELWQSAENAILAEDGIDPVSGKSWQELIDPVSWAKKFLLEECFGNIDAPILSQNYYRDGTADAKICAGPAWDYEVAMSRETNAVYMYRDNLHGSWWNLALYRKPEFNALLKQEYADVFRPLLLEAVEKGILRHTDRIAGAVNMNGRRWNLSVLPEQTEKVRSYLEERVAFLDKVWLEERELITVTVTGYNGSSYTYLQEPGSVLPELRSYEEYTNIVSQGWYYDGTKTPADPEAPLYEDTAVTFRWKAKPKAPAAQPVQAQPEPIPLSRLAAVLAFLAMLGGLLLAEWNRRRRTESNSNKRPVKTK